MSAEPGSGAARAGSVLLLGCGLLSPVLVAVNLSGALPCVTVSALPLGVELLLLLAVLVAARALSPRGAGVALGLATALYGGAAVLVAGVPGLLPALGFGLAAAAVTLTVASLRIQIRELRTAAERHSRTDTLTGLPDRAACAELLAHEVARCLRSGLSLTVLLVGLDSFGDLVDLEGLPAEDSSLRRVAAVLRTQTRDSDVLARFGEDQFAILLPACGENDAVRRAEHIRSLVERTAMTWPCPLTVSVGAATVPLDARAAPELVALAERALASARHGGHNRVVLASGVDTP